MKTALLTVLSLLSLMTAVFANEQNSFGLKQIKGVVNGVTFQTASLENTGTAHDIVKLEQKIIDERALHVDQVTSIDTVLEKVEMNQNSLYLKIGF